MRSTLNPKYQTSNIHYTANCSGELVMIKSPKELWGEQLSKSTSRLWDTGHACEGAWDLSDVERYNAGIVVLTLCCREVWTV